MATSVLETSRLLQAPSSASSVSVRCVVDAIVSHYVRSCAGGLSSAPFIIAQFGNIIGYTRRLGQVLSAMDLRSSLSVTKFFGRVGPLSHSEIVVKDVMCKTPPSPTDDIGGDAPLMGEARVLFQHLSFTVKTGSNLLIVGPSGCGKV